MGRNNTFHNWHRNQHKSFSVNNRYIANTRHLKYCLGMKSGTTLNTPRDWSSCSANDGHFRCLAGDMCTAHQLDANPIKSSMYYYSSNLVTGNKNYIVNFPDFYLYNFTHFGCIPGFLWVGAFVGWIRYVTEWNVNPRIWGDCKLYRFLFFFCEHYSSALLVIMSLEKFFA